MLLSPYGLIQREEGEREIGWGRAFTADTKYSRAVFNFCISVFSSINFFYTKCLAFNTFTVCVCMYSFPFLSNSCTFAFNWFWVWFYFLLFSIAHFLPKYSLICLQSFRLHLRTRLSVQFMRVYGFTTRPKWISFGLRMLSLTTSMGRLGWPLWLWVRLHSQTRQMRHHASVLLRNCKCIYVATSLFTPHKTDLIVARMVCNFLILCPSFLSNSHASSCKRCIAIAMILREQ